MLKIQLSTYPQNTVRAYNHHQNQPKPDENKDLLVEEINRYHALDSPAEIKQDDLYYDIGVFQEFVINSQENLHYNYIQEFDFYSRQKERKNIVISTR